jgi:tetratricopeptide (TPR) repeat protein
LRPWLPSGRASRAIVTSNAPNWGAVATPVPIHAWPQETGADFLFARTGRQGERAAAEALSETLGGLPLAHEMAASFCERTGMSFAEYRGRFDAEPVRLLDSSKDAPAEYHDRLTVAKTFALAIDEAAKLHPAAEPLIILAALLAPEPIPLFLFSEGFEKLGEPFAALVADGGLDEAVAALRAFTLVECETISDERDPTITTDSIRLHRLVREVAAAKLDRESREGIRGELIEAMAMIYPKDVNDDPKTWPRARRLNALALALVGADISPLNAGLAASDLMGLAGLYKKWALGADAEARALFERALEICDQRLGPDHADTAWAVNNLALVLINQRDFASARPLCDRAIAITEKAYGPEHPITATCLNNLGGLLLDSGDFASALPLFERALEITENVFGGTHPDTSRCLTNIGGLLATQGRLEAARPFFERALAIDEIALPPDHPDTARSLQNLAGLLGRQGDLAAARPLLERALAILDKVLGPEHPNTALVQGVLARLTPPDGQMTPPP